MINELIIPASALEVVKQFEGSSDQLGHFLKNQVLDVMRHSGLLGYLGSENIFSDEDKALESIYAEVIETRPDAKRRLLKQHIGGSDGISTWR